MRDASLPLAGLQHSSAGTRALAGVRCVYVRIAAARAPSLTDGATVRPLVRCGYMATFGDGLPGALPGAGEELAAEVQNPAGGAGSPTRGGSPRGFGTWNDFDLVDPHEGPPGGGAGGGRWARLWAAQWAIRPRPAGAGWSVRQVLAVTWPVQVLVVLFSLHASLDGCAAAPLHISPSCPPTPFYRTHHFVDDARETGPPTAATFQLRTTTRASPAAPATSSRSAAALPRRPRCRPPTTSPRRGPGPTTA